MARRFAPAHLSASGRVVARARVGGFTLLETLLVMTLMAAAAILADPDIGHDDASVREAMSGNICRCGAYKNILAAVQEARGKTQGAR